MRKRLFSVRVYAPLNDDLPSELVYQVYDRIHIVDGWIIGHREGVGSQNIARLECSRGTVYFMATVEGRERRYQSIDINPAKWD